MQKAYVYGCGNYFKIKYEDISSKYDIEEIFDSNVIGDKEIVTADGKKYKVVKPHAIDEASVVIIAIYRYRMPKYMCLNAGIKENQILYTFDFLPLTEEELKVIEEREKFRSDFLTKSEYLYPLNRTFGISRGGTPIDRKYLENWLNKNRHLISGDVMEIADNDYTYTFGSNVKSYVLHKAPENESQIKGDFVTGEGLVEESMDCVIMTQTISYIYDYKKVFENLKRVLKKGGRAFVTCDGIAQIARYDADRWGYYFRYSEMSLKNVVEEIGFTDCKIESFGNVKTACALLYGITAEELNDNDFEINDIDYPVSICMMLQK